MSMYNLKGFVRIKPLVNNALGVIAPLGELSTYAMTFTKERGEYQTDSFPNLTLISFSSRDLANGSITVAPNYVEHVLGVINNVYEFARNFTGNVQILDILNNLINTFGNNTQNIEAGPLVTGPSVSMPEWISWSNPALGPNKFKIWLSDSSFIRLFDEYSITIIPPVTNLDDLFREANYIVKALEDVTPSSVMDQIQYVKNRNPETAIRAETFDFTSTNIGSYKTKLSWYAVINGAAGDNNDVIRSEIISYCLNNSSFGLNDWKQVMPDLFKATEFILMPSWTNYAIPNRTVQAGIYSPINSIVSVVSEYKNRVTFIDHPHIDSHLQIFVHPYRSISIAVVGNVDNRGGLFRLTDHYKDFISIGSTNTDYNRMSKETQNWSYQLQELLIIAENLNEYIDLPANIRKVVRDNQVYVSKTINNIQYLIYAKTNLV